MKRNHFYAEAKSYPGMKDNGIRPEQLGHEGEDMFILEPKYLDAYARYFGKYIDAYKAEGIPVGMVMPQNEFNSAQNFPSCTWTPEGLTQFIRALGPEMEKRGVDVYFGTLERGNPKLLETVLADPTAARSIKGLGAQWEKMLFPPCIVSSLHCLCSSLSRSAETARTRGATPRIVGSL